MPTHSITRTVARDAARLAGMLCLDVRNQMLRNPAVMEKKGREPVTIADYGSQAIILHKISQVFPDAASLAEERAAEFAALATPLQQAQIVHFISNTLNQGVSLDEIQQWLDFGHGKSSRYTWTVDPIDGTKGFLRGEQFAIAIALLIDGVPLLAALACPLLPVNLSDPNSNTGIVAVAVAGQGATVEPLMGGPARPLHVSNRRDISKARITHSVEPAHTDHAFNERVVRRAGIEATPVKIDSQAKYAVVADGASEIYIRHSGSPEYRENIWDHAAGYLIVKEAGGRVTDLDGKDLDFSLGDKLIRNRGVLATNDFLHEKMLEAIAAESHG